MKKVFGMIALAVALAACNKKEIDLQPMEQPFDNAGGITITATLASKNVGTRAVTDDGSNIVVDWAKNEHLAILYEVDGVKKAADAEITGVDGDGTATISFTVDGSTANNTPCTIVYPLSAAKDDNSGRKSDTELLSTQDGKLSAALDVRVGAGTIQTTTTGLTVTTQPEPQFAIARFTIQDLSGNAKDVSFFKFYYWEYGKKTEAIVTPSPAAGVLYVALPAVSSQTVRFSATSSDSKTYTCSKDGVTFAAAKYYQSTLKMAAYTLLSAATTSDVGKVVCADGHLRDAKTAVPAGGTAVGILGKVTETGHGLILALQDAPAQTWYTINGWTSTTDFAGTTLKVLPDDAARGSLTSYTTLGTTAVSDWAVAQKSDYEAIFTNLGSTNSDSNGTTYDDNVNAYITTGVGGTALSSNYRYWSATVLNNEYAWDFHSYYSWYSGYKTSSYSVRPVLGF